MVVNAPVVDLRAQPHTTAQPNIHDPLEETQLLYGEAVRVRKQREGWAYIEAVEQPEFTHATRWQGYPGWVPVSSLAPWNSLFGPTMVVTVPWAWTYQDAYLIQRSPWRFPLGAGLRATNMGGAVWKVELLDGSIVWMAARDAGSLGELLAVPAIQKRQLILRAAESLIGEPYYWGGRSPGAKGQEERAYGLDCSALVNLAYRSVGMVLPRDAHEQFLRARRRTAPDVGDLIFLSEPGNATRIVHVMLYAGQNNAIEGPGTGNTVRRISLHERLGRSLDQLASGTIVNEQTVFFGAYLPSN